MSFILPVLGGLGLFIYGMNIMADGLQKSAGNRLRSIIEKLTTNRFMGLLVGTVVTMLIQSSSATTVMVIGFVNAGIMTLGQAVGVIMGANLGTTVTGQLIALNLTDYAPIAIAIGVGMYTFGKKKKTKNISEILIGFGILFVGLGTMGSGLEPLSKMPIFTTVLTKMENPVWAMLTGLVMTTMLQSSSASIGILQALASQKLININIAFPILFGDNIGTTTTALISGIGANTTAKRAAMLHFIFNLIGTILFMTILRIPIQKLVLTISPGNVMKQIANAHTLFNLINVIIQIPFANFLVKMVEIIVPGKIQTEEKVSKFLDARFMETPSIAVNQVKKEVIHMGEMALQNLNDTRDLLFSGDEELLDKVFLQEKAINKLNREIIRYIVDLSSESLSISETERLNMFLYIINDLERIGDHVENIAEFTKTDNGVIAINFTEMGRRDAKAIFNGTIRIVQMALTAFERVDYNLATDVIALEEDIDQMELRFRKNHMQRLNDGVCSIESGLVFLDTMSNLERISDHSYNIARHVEDIHKGKLNMVTPSNF